MNARTHNRLADHRATWLADFERAVADLDTGRQHTGRIEWPSAVHLYNLGLTVDTAAAQYFENRKEIAA